MARGQFSTTVLDSDGDVQTSKPIVFYEPGTAGATPLAQTLYDARSGGSIVASPQTNSVGQLDVYADNAQYVEYKVNGGALQMGRIDPDPAQVVLLAATQALTNKTLTSPTITGGNIGNHTSAGMLQTLKIYPSGAVTPSQGFDVNASNQVLLFEAAHTAPTLDSNFQLVKTLTRPASILLDSTAYITSIASAVSTTGTASSGVVGSPGPGKLTHSGIGWTASAYANQSVYIVSGTGAGQWGLISDNDTDTLTLYAGAVWPLAPDATSVYRIYSKSGVDPSNVKFNTFIAQNSFCDARALEINIVGSALRGEGTLWGMQSHVHPGVATTDGTDKIVACAALISPADTNPGHLTVAALTAIQGDVAILAQGDNVGTGWNKYLKGIDKDGATQLYFSSVAATPAMYLRTNSASKAGGIQIYEPGSTTSYLAVYLDTSHNAYIQNAPSGGNGHYLVMGPNTTDPGFWFNAMSAHTGDIVRFGITGSTLSAINASGHFTVAGVKVVGAQGSAIADLTDAFGTADGTVQDVTGVHDQTILNNNFQEMSTKINLILARLRASSGHGLIA